MALNHTALWISLATTSIAVQAQPIDQATSVIQTIPLNVSGSATYDVMAGIDRKNPRGRTLQDINTDQLSDLIWADRNGIYLATGEGAGLFNQPVTLFDDSANTPGFLDTTSDSIISNSSLDLNQDGIADVISKMPNDAVSSTVSFISIFTSDLGNNQMVQHQFPSVNLTSASYGLHDYLDINGDGQYEMVSIGRHYDGANRDALLKTHTISVNGSGVPTAVTVQSDHTFDLPNGTNNFDLRLADLNGDNKLDAVFVADNATSVADLAAYDSLEYGDVFVYFQQDNFTWSARTTIKQDLVINDGSGSSSNALGHALLTADFDQDNRTDILTFQASKVNSSGGLPQIDSYTQPVIYWQQTDGSFSEEIITSDQFIMSSEENTLIITDINSDQKPDIIFSALKFDSSDPMAPAITYQSLWFSNLGQRQFSNNQFLTENGKSRFFEAMFISDLNGDQQTDLLFNGQEFDTMMGPLSEGIYYLNPDIYPPVATFTPDNSSHENQAYNVTVTLNETVTGFEESDVEINGGSISNWQENSAGLSYQFLVTPEAETDTVLMVKAQSFQDTNLQLNQATSETRISAPTPIPADADGDGILDELESGDYNGDGIDDSLQVDPGIESGIGGGALTPLLFLLALPLLFAAHGVRAQQAASEESGWDKLVDTIENTAYAGVNFGFSYLNPEDGNSGWRQQDQFYGSHGITLGFRPNIHSFVEYQHQQLGKTQFENNNPNIPGSQTLRYSANTLFGGVYLNELSEYKVFVRAGLNELTTINSSALNNDQQNKTLLATGTGVEWTGNEKWQLRIGADRYSADVYNLYFSAQYQIK